MNRFRWTAHVLMLALLPFARPSAADAPPAPVDLTFKAAGEVVSHPIWGVEARIPGYQAWDTNDLAWLHQKPNFVFAAESRQTCSLPVTMWVERVPSGTTAEQCRRAFAGNPDAVRKDKDARLIEEQVSPITYTVYDISLKQAKLPAKLNNQLYGYWVRGDHCFELHVSSIDCQEFKDQAVKILQSVKLSEDTGATLETVALAMHTGGDPRDWKTHLAFAGLALYGAEPGKAAKAGSNKLSNPEAARHFYESAMRLGGEAVGPKDLWLIEEGIGISWLTKDDGKSALPHLERALAVGKAAPDQKIPLNETLYNLACAAALTGDTEAACGRVEELLVSVGAEERRSQLKNVGADPQLKALRKADCYKMLEREFQGK